MGSATSIRYVRGQMVRWLQVEVFLLMKENRSTSVVGEAVAACSGQTSG